MKFTNIISQITKAALAAAFAFFSIVATAQTLPSGMSVDNDYQSGQVGYYYVNMPTVGSSKTITLTTSFPSSFKVYDNGGKNGNYKDGGKRAHPKFNGDKHKFWIVYIRKIFHQ